MMRRVLAAIYFAGFAIAAEPVHAADPPVSVFQCRYTSEGLSDTDRDALRVQQERVSAQVKSDLSALDACQEKVGRKAGAPSPPQCRELDDKVRSGFARWGAILDELDQGGPRLVEGCGWETQSTTVAP